MPNEPSLRRNGEGTLPQAFAPIHGGWIGPRELPAAESAYFTAVVGWLAGPAIGAARIANSFSQVIKYNVSFAKIGVL